MKIILAFSFFLFISSLLHAQLYTQAGSTLYMSNGGMIAVSNSDCKLNNNVESNGNGKILFTGSRAQTLDANGYSIYGLDIDNSNGISLLSDLQINNTLTLSNGIIATGSSILYIPSTASVNRENGWVNGFLKKYITTGNNITVNFETGDDTYYTPVSFTYNKVSAAGDITAASIQGASNASAYTTFPLSKTNYINRYWKISAGNTLSFDTYSATLNYSSADIQGTVNTASLKAGIYNSGWNTYSTTANSYANTFSNAVSHGDMLLAVDDDTVSTRDTTTASACDNYTWSADGITYDSSGTYTYTNGSSTDVLILTITGSTRDTTTASACDSYTWSADGITYDSSGTYTYTNGCNTKVLMLTITGSTRDTTTASACSSYTWSADGVTYDSSGTYAYTSGCNTKVLVLTIANGSVPAKPGSISGQQFNLCNASGNITYSVADVSGATSYAWTAPSGTSIVSGNGTNSIQLSISSAFKGGDRLSVSAVNSCGTSVVRNLLLQVKPTKPVISGSSCVSAGQTGLNYVVTNAEDGVTYTWRVPGKAKITGGQGTDTVTVDWRSSSGTISCAPSNTCATGARGRYTITVGCATAAAAQNKDAGITVYPNPSSGLVNVLFTAAGETKYKIVLTDITGRTIMSKELMASAGQNKISFDLSKYADGVYFLSLADGEKIETVKIVRGN